MADFFLHIYDRLVTHRKLAFVIVLATLLLSIWSLSRLHYEEDISGFLPIDSRDSLQTAIMEQLTSQSSVAVLFRDHDDESSCEDRIVRAMDLYEEIWYNRDTLSLVPDMSATVDESMAFELIQFVQEHYASFLTPADYARMDSLVAIPNWVEQKLEEDKRSLQMLSGSFTQQTIPYDPLGLFSNILLRLADLSSDVNYRLVDGHILHKEMPVGLLVFESPFGSSESGQNAHLKQLSEEVAAMVSQSTEISVSVVGAPIIAVTNAERIKRDSLWAVVLAVIGILTVLWFSFKRIDYILWIAGTLLFGAIFSLGVVGIVKDSISIIVIGLGSVIVGIAANYPLHFLHSVHETGDKRESLSEMVVPLLVGNITTVSAFLCLLFLKAKAMHDLALFGSFMLVGTILFSLIFLPIWVKSEGVRDDNTLNEKRDNAKGVGRKIGKVISPFVIIITIAMLIWGDNTGFDTDLNHINYMTEQQREDIALLSSGMDATDGMNALSILSAMLQPEELKEAQRERWVSFWSRNQHIVEQLESEAQRVGFSQGAFEAFLTSTRTEPEIVSREDVTPQSMSSIMATLVEALSDDFNTILFLCGFIVFVFLWVSFGRLELALISFLPLTVGWIWILSIMNMFGIDFSIVSIILATFIFGQGDDYTIFITEGLMRGYARNEDMLDGRRKSVIISAVIMFIGIGTLIVARHPAMHSLAQITMLGMAVVVIMAQFLPEWLFCWLTTKGGVRRLVPVTLARLGRTIFAFSFLILSVVVVTPVTCLLFIGPKRAWKDRWLHGVIYHFSNFVIRRVPATGFNFYNRSDWDFTTPSIIISNHQSHLDLMCLLMLSPKMVVITNDWVWRNPIYGALIRRAEFVPAAQGVDSYIPQLKSLVERGYSIVVFPEGTRSQDSSILRFHKGAFYLAQTLGLDIVPVMLHGVGHVLPKNEFMLRPGRITVTVGERIKCNDTMWGSTTRDMTRNVHKFYIDWYAQVCREYEDVSYWLKTVQMQYMYKGMDVEHNCNKRLRQICLSEESLNEIAVVDGRYDVDESGQGEKSLLIALTHPDTEVYAYMDDEERFMIARSATVKPQNLHYILR